MGGKWGGGGTKCYKCSKTAYGGEQVSFDKMIFHVKCFTCVAHNGKIAQSEGFKHKEPTDEKYSIYCRKCASDKGLNRKQTKVTWTKKATSSGGGSSKYGGGNIKCHTCSKTVYQGELLKYESMPFHPNCLICHDCSTKKSVAQMGGKFENNIFCTKCW